MNRLNKSAVFLYCRFSLFLKDMFFPDYSMHLDPLGHKVLRYQEISMFKKLVFDLLLHKDILW